MRDSIINHLVCFHNLSAFLSGIPFGNDCGVEWAKNSPKTWPSAVIGRPSNNNFQTVIERIESGQWPPFWIMPTQDAEAFTDGLTKNCFKEVRRWEGMYLDRNSEKESVQSIDGYSIIRVVNQSEVEDWYRIVKGIILPSTVFPESIPKGLTGNPSVSMRLGVFNGEAVSAGLLFTYDNVGGLYFISSLPNSRGKGYASALVSALIEDAWDAQAKHIVLHASPTGKNIYERLGFISDGQLSNLWRVGKF